MIAPRGGFFDLEGRWAVENVGTSPDIEVENWPREVIAGRDPQLERAVAEGLRLLREHPVNRATREPASPTWGARVVPSSVIPQERSECRDLPSLRRSRPRGKESRSRHSVAALPPAG